MTDANETEQVTKIFLNLGAEPKLALQMAKQLLKRAEQRSNEEVSKTDALKELLEFAVYGAQGMLKPGDDAQSQQKKP